MIASPVIVLGGLSSLIGALVAGLLQSFTDRLLTLLVLMLMLRPQGLFGRRGTERV